MESSVVVRSYGALQSVAHAQPCFERTAFIPTIKESSRRCVSFQVHVEPQRLIFSKSPKRASLWSSVMATQTASALTTNDSATQGLSQMNKDQKSTFPNGIEALVLGVCDGTDVAELELKVGGFEMLLKRDVGSPAATTLIAPSVAPPAPPPPFPSKPEVESTPATQKATPQKSSPFANNSSLKGSKLEALEASGSNTYVLVSSPTVGLFRSGRTLKGKKQPPSCKEGDMIKEGQTIGFLDQFGSELPVKSSVAGELLKVLYKDGEPVGYGDALVAVLPSFHGIK